MPEPPKFSNPFEFDQLMLEPVHAMMANGIRVDQEKKHQLREETIDKWNREQDLLDDIVGVPESRSFNVSSHKQVAGFLYGHLGMPKRTRKDRKTGKTRLRTDEDALRAMLAECRDKVNTLKTDSAKSRWMQAALTCFYTLRVRGVRKKISSYLGMRIKDGRLKGERPFEDDDGKIRGTISVGGTETGRFSHSKTLWGTGINLATVPRELRCMYIADDGYEIAEFDLNRGESWVYAHLSEDPELLRIHLDGLDFHSETAATISVAFGDPLSVDWIIEHKHGSAYKIRYLGKKTNHASSYRMGAFKGAETINEEADETGITVTVREFRKAQDLWLSRYHYVKELWWPSIEAQLNKDRTMRTPYGRVHQFHDAWGEELFKSATAYVPQSTSVDYLNRGFLRVHHRFVKTGAWGLQVLAQSHDSILVQYLAQHRHEAIPEISNALASTLTIKGRKFTIPIEASYGPSWGETTEYKLAA